MLGGWNTSQPRLAITCATNDVGDDERRDKGCDEGLVAMRLQEYFTAIVVNMKRIVAVIPG